MTRVRAPSAANSTSVTMSSSHVGGSPVIAGGATQIENSAVIQHADIAIIPGRNLQTDDPVRKSIGINFDDDGFFRFFPGLFLAWTSLWFFLFGLLRLFFLSLFGGLTDFIALWRERIRSVFCQCNEIYALHVAIDIGEFLIAERWFEIAC